MNTKNTIEARGAWDLEKSVQYLLDTTFPLRLATIGSDGFPLVVSVWFFYDEGLIWCAVQNDSSMAINIEENSNVGFEVGPNETPYMGVRGQGKAKLFPERGGEKLKKLINRYLDEDNKDLADWLLSRTETETAICIEPEWFYSWDYSERMD